MKFALFMCKKIGRFIFESLMVAIILIWLAGGVSGFWLFIFDPSIESIWFKLVLIFSYWIPALLLLVLWIIHEYDKFNTNEYKKFKNNTGN